MKTKLTLSLPEKTVLEVKQIAKQRKTTVSALFAQSVSLWRLEGTVRGLPDTELERDLSDLLGILDPQAPFDERSKRIREKHG